MFFINSEGPTFSYLLNILYLSVIVTVLGTVFFWGFLGTGSFCFVTKNCSKSSYIWVFILSKKQHNWFHKTLHKSGMLGRRKLPDPSLNCIFNAPSIGVQYTLSFQWTNFGLKCLLLSATILILNFTAWFIY